MKFTIVAAALACAVSVRHLPAFYFGADQHAKRMKGMPAFEVGVEYDRALLGEDIDRPFEGDVQAGSPMQLVDFLVSHLDVIPNDGRVSMEEFSNHITHMAKLRIIQEAKLHDVHLKDKASQVVTTFAHKQGGLTVQDLRHINHHTDPETVKPHFNPDGSTAPQLSVAEAFEFADMDHDGVVSHIKSNTPRALPAIACAHDPPPCRPAHATLAAEPGRVHPLRCKAARHGGRERPAGHRARRRQQPAGPGRHGRRPARGPAGDDGGKTRVGQRREGWQRGSRVPLSREA
jgi:hypothetical protein